MTNLVAIIFAFAFSKHPPLMVTNVDFLLSQPDPPPKKLILPSQPGVSKSPK